MKRLFHFAAFLLAVGYSAVGADILGVNYYPPFWEDYRLLKDRGIDFHRTIDDDIQHFRRLGLDCLRLHAIDREISTKEGALVENEHLDILDYLLASAISNGMRVVLTPVAWFKGPADGKPKGFSQDFSKERLCSELRPEAIVRRYLREFVSHVNRYTGVRYADEPGIVGFECFNEPRYAEGFSDGQLTAHVNRLADAIRSTGTVKPIFYSVWQGRTEAIAAANVDGLTVSAYPNDIQHGCETDSPSLERVRKISYLTNSIAASKAKIAYEFDSADTCCTFMIPAIARMFRSQGIQAAAMFQYDELPLASENAATRTHYLNLVYTPGKAIAMAIAAEVFRRLPRGCDFEEATSEMIFPPFRLDRSRDCAELAAEDCYYYTNGALTPPPDPSKLRHVWGVGHSTVVASRGTGAYFLDRMGAGRWRLQLYPDVFRTADPFTGRKGEKVVVLDRKVTLTVNLPDLGNSFSVTLAPGDYVLTKGGMVLPASAKLEGARFALPPTLCSSPRMNPQIPRQMRADRPTDVACPSVFADKVMMTFTDEQGCVVRLAVTDGLCRVPAGTLHSGKWFVRAEAKGANGSDCRPTVDDFGAISRGGNCFWTTEVLTKSSEWNFFDARRYLNAWLFGNNQSVQREGQDELGGSTYRVRCGAFAGGKGAFTVRQNLDGMEFARVFPDVRRPEVVIVRMRAVTKKTDRIEFVLYDDKDRPWGKTIPISTHWREIRIPVKKMRYFTHWTKNPLPLEGESLDARNLRKCAFTLGGWLFKNDDETPHEIEVASIRVE